MCHTYTYYCVTRCSSNNNIRTVTLPTGSAGKESTCNEGDLGSIPGLGRSPGEGKGYPLQYSGLENSMDYSPWGRKESDTTEQLSLSLCTEYCFPIYLGLFNPCSNLLRKVQLYAHLEDEQLKYRKIDSLGHIVNEYQSQGSHPPLFTPVSMIFTTMIHEKRTWVCRTLNILEKTDIKQINTFVIPNADKIYKKRAQCLEIGWHNNAKALPAA